MGCCGNYEKDKVSKNDDNDQDLKYKKDSNFENLSNPKDQEEEKVKDIEKEKKKNNEKEKEKNKVNKKENEDEKKIDSDNNESVKSNSDDNQLSLLIELVKFFNRNEEENQYTENDISDNEEDKKINNELDKIFKNNFIYYPKMNFLSLCKFLELDVDERKKKEIIIDDILKNNEEKINNIEKDIKDFRILNLLVLCNNDDQMELMAKFYRKIVPKINCVFSCFIYFIIYYLDIFNIMQKNIILMPLSDISANVLKKLYKYNESILGIFLYYFGDYKIDISFLPKNVSIQPIFSNYCVIIVFREFMKNIIIPNQGNNNYLEQGKLELSIKLDMPYKINLNNFSQKYLEYRDKTSIYNSTNNFTYLALFQAYDFYNSIYLKEAYNESERDRMIENLTIISDLLEIFTNSENQIIEVAKFLKNLYIICMNIFDYTYCINLLDKDTIVNIFDNDFSNLDFDAKKKKSEEIVLKIAECCNFLVSKMNEEKCIFFEEKLKILQIKII